MTQDDLQEEVISKALEFYSDNERGYLNLAMRSGKTRITLEVLKRLGYEIGHVLILYPDNKLKAVWEEECIKWNFNNINIRYSNFSSIWKCDNQDYDVIICDEFHSLSENEESFLTGLSASMWLFLSGTISKETKMKWPNFKEIFKFTTNEGINQGILADYKITVHLVELDNIVKTPNKKSKLLTEKQKYDNYSYVISQMRYNGQNSMHLALARNRLSLSSIGKVEYTKKLLGELEDSGKRAICFTGLTEVAEKLDIPYFHSKSENDDDFRLFQEGKYNVLSLAAIGKVGVTYKNLDSVILMNFTYNAEESSQILNRAIKLDYTGKIADLHVICLNEPPELKKVKESLSMLDQTKIKYV